MFTNISKKLFQGSTKTLNISLTLPKITTHYPSPYDMDTKSFQNITNFLASTYFLRPITEPLGDLIVKGLGKIWNRS